MHLLPRQLRTAPGKLTKTLAILLCAALGASAPLVLGQAEREAAAAQAAAPGTLRFPIAGQDGTVDLTWVIGDEVRAGQDFEYTLRVTNTSRIPLHNVVIHQALPGGIQISKSSPQPDQGGQQQMGQQQQPAQQSGQQKQEGQQQGGQQQGGQQPGAQDTQMLSWRLGALEPGQARNVRVTASAQNPGAFDACAWVSFLPTLCREIKVIQPELRLTQLVVDANGNPRDLFYACETVFVLYRVTNTGTGATSPATILSNLPQGLVVEGERDLRLPVGRINAGETVERTVRLQPTQPGALTIRGRATTGELEATSNPSQVRIVKPELALRVQAPRQTYLGRSVTYQISVTNTSDVPALNTVVQMPAPAGGLRFVSNDQEIPQEVDRYQVGRLGPGETRTFGVTFDPSDIGTIGTTATATAYCADAVTKKVATEIAGVPAVQISVIDRQDPVKVGETTVYEVQVINEGSAEDLNIELSGQLQGPLEFVEGTGETKVTGKGNSVQFTPIDSLPPGGVANWLVTVKGAKPGNGKLQLELRSKAAPRGTISSEPTTVF